MRNWLLGAFVAAVGMPVGQAFAFSENEQFDQNTPFGKCNVIFLAVGETQSAYVSVSNSVIARDAGGSRFTEGTVEATDALTTDFIAGCLGVEPATVTNLIQNGADGTFESDDVIGFSFRLTENAGEFFLANKTYTFQVGGGSLTASPATDAGDAAEGAVIQADATRQLSSQISSNQRLVREGRSRFIQSRRQMAGGGSGLVSRNNVDFDLDGAFDVDNGRISTKGTFFEQAGNYEGTSRRIFFGDFDIQHDSDTNSTTASLSGKVAWERMLNDQNMLGYFVGADLAYSDIGGLYNGEQNSYGVSVGAYYVSALREDLFMDSFISLGVGQNDLKLSNGIVDLKGDYTSYTATVGAALTGVIERDGYEIWPEIALTYGYTDLGTIGMTDRNATTVNNQVIVDADSVSIANLTIRPEFRVPMDGRLNADSLSLFTFAPRLVCEQVDAVRTTEDCGGGAELGIDSTSEDGASRLVARIKADRIASSTRTGLELKLEHQF